MKLSTIQRRLEQALVTERILDSIHKSVTVSLVLPAGQTLLHIAGDEKVSLVAIMALVATISIRAAISGMLHKAKFRLSLAKIAFDKEQNKQQ